MYQCLLIKQTEQIAVDYDFTGQAPQAKRLAGASLIGAREDLRTCDG